MTPNEDYKKSSLYREFTAEQEEIVKHKWLESEKAKHDVGFEYALKDLITRHRSKWRKARIAAGYGVQPRRDSTSNGNTSLSPENRPAENYQNPTSSISSRVEERAV